MSTTERRHKLKDVANAAAILTEAVRNGPGRDLSTVSTPYGTADVILDDSGADVDFHGTDVTVHVRREN